MSEKPIGYVRAPKNSNGIVRSKTTGQLRAWTLDRSLKQLDKINQNELGKLEFPSIYVLFEKRKAYIGEAKSIYSRTKEHMTSPDPKIKNWDRILIINDGRPATHDIYIKFLEKGVTLSYSDQRIDVTEYCLIKD